MDQGSQKIRILILGDHSTGKTTISRAFLMANSRAVPGPRVFDMALAAPNPRQVTTKEMGTAVVHVNGKATEIELVICTWLHNNTSHEGTVPEMAVDEGIKNCLKDSHGIVVVYDVTKKKTLTRAKHLLEYLTMKTAHESIILCGNKADPSWVHDRVISKVAGRNLAESFGVEWIETSGREGVNVGPMFYHLISHVIGHQRRSWALKEFQDTIVFPVVGPLYVKKKKKDCILA